MRVPSFMLAVTVLLLIILSIPALADEMKNDDKTLSPYFLVTGDSEVDQFALKSTSALVNIAGVIADVTVKQVYKNEGQKAIEAIYVFPASTRAAVYAMKMTIGKRIIEAKIKEREQARKDYEEAKDKGQTASLLEQQRPNVFQMNVANILPGDNIEVELKYNELLIPEDSTYEFSYPTVVGPRYSNVKASEVKKSEGWVQNPYLHSGKKAPYEFDIKVNISAGLPVSMLTCKTHKTTVDWDGKNDATVSLDPKDKFAGNKDFILEYKLAGNKIASGLLMYQGKDENFFLAMIQPPKGVKPEHIPPREYVFIVDVSGSMNGFPLDISKKLLKNLIGNLRSTDKFNVLLFAGTSNIMSEQSLPATKENIKKAIDVIDNQRGGGGTELLPALKRALDLKTDDDFARTIIIATDGYVRVEEEAFDLIRNNIGKANMFSFGIGSSVNRFIIEGMARVGEGEPFIITNPGEADEKAEKFRQLIQSPVLTNIKIDFGKLDVYDVEPLGVPDVLAERPVIVYGKWKGSPKGEITLKGRSGNDKYSQVISVNEVKARPENSALKYLWARHKIAILADYNKLAPKDERVKEVTNLGLKYNLLTAYTSFVAIDSEIRLKDGKAITVRQPLPLPEGVSDYAVGGSSQAYRTSPMTSYGLGVKHKGLSGNVSLKDRAVEMEALTVSEKPKEESKKQTHVTGIASIDKIEIKGKIGEEKVKNLLEKNLGYIKWCFDSELRKYPSLKGTVTLVLSIDKNGVIKKAVVKKTTFKNKRLDRCLERRIRTIRFGATDDKNPAEVTVTFSFKTAG